MHLITVLISEGKLLLSPKDAIGLATDSGYNKSKITLGLPGGIKALALKLMTDSHARAEDGGG